MRQRRWDMKKLQTLRKRYFSSAKEFALKVGATRGAVAKWESGRTVPQLFALPIMAKELRVTMDTLVSAILEDFYFRNK